MSRRLARMRDTGLKIEGSAGGLKIKPTSKLKKQLLSHRSSACPGRLNFEEACSILSSKIMSRHWAQFWAE